MKLSAECCFEAVGDRDESGMTWPVSPRSGVNQMRTQLVVFVALLGLSSVGCQSMWPGKAMRTARHDTPESDDPWIRSAGDIARTEHTYEEVQDPLRLRKYFTSDKAREIERNVGVGD